MHADLSPWLCCAVLCCAVLCCAVLCSSLLCPGLARSASGSRTGGHGGVYSQAGKKAEDMSQRFAEAHQRSTKLMRALEELQESHLSVLQQNAQLRSQVGSTCSRDASHCKHKAAI